MNARTRPYKLATANGSLVTAAAARPRYVHLLYGAVAYGRGKCFAQVSKSQHKEPFEKVLTLLSPAISPMYSAKHLPQITQNRSTSPKISRGIPTS